MRVVGTLLGAACGVNVNEGVRASLALVGCAVANCRL